MWCVGCLCAWCVCVLVHNTVRPIVFTIIIVSGRCWSSMWSRAHNVLCVSSRTAHQRVYNMQTSNNNKTAYLDSLLSTLQNWFQLREIIILGNELFIDPQASLSQAIRCRVDRGLESMIIIFGHDINCLLTEYYLNGEPNRKSCFWTEIFLNGSVNKQQTWLLRMHSSLHLVKYMIWLLNPDHSKASKFKV